MTPGGLYGLAGVMILALGIGGAILCGDPVRRILALNILGSGAFLALVGLGQRSGAPDPVPQAMVLTGIVVAVAATALGLALVRRLQEDEAGSGEPLPSEDGEEEAGPAGAAARPGEPPPDDAQAGRAQAAACPSDAGARPGEPG